MRFGLALLLVGCGAPDFSAFPATHCGLRYEGVSASEIQLVEDTIVETFQSSLDPHLHDVCTALNGWKLTVTSEPIIPGPSAIDDADPNAPVNGVTMPELWEIRVFSAHLILPHEAAHVAQGCSEASGFHTGWWNVCSIGVCVCADGKDGVGGACTSGLVQPQLIEARSRIDAALGL